MGPGHKARSCSLGTGELALAGEQTAGLFRVHETHGRFLQPSQSTIASGSGSTSGTNPAHRSCLDSGDRTSAPQPLSFRETPPCLLVPSACTLSSYLGCFLASQ